MEKQIFLDRVKQHLLGHGIGEAMVDRQIRRIDAFIESEYGEQAESMLKHEDPIKLAEEIYAALQQSLARQAARQQPRPAAPPPPPPAPVVPDAPTLVQPVVRTAEHRPAPQTDAPTLVQPTVGVIDPTVRVPDAPTLVQPTVQQTAQVTDAPTLTQPAVRADTYTADSIYIPPLEDEQTDYRHRRDEGGLEVDRFRSRAMGYADAPKSALFWVTYLLCIPFLCAATVAMYALFLLGFVICPLLIVASIAALVAVAAAGTALSLVALVYGIVQALSVLPIGLYELGIGLTIGAIALFVSILLYNLAIRLLPAILRLLGSLFGRSFGGVRAMFLYVKGACAKL